MVLYPPFCSKINMAVPNVIIIGAQKAGTSALFNWLSQHPDIDGPTNMKDFPFFVDENIYSNGMNWFSNLFADDKKIVLHGHVNYLYHSKVSSKRIKEEIPEAKLICVLRNPTERAYSAFWQAKKAGYESCESFEVALENEKKFFKNNGTDVKFLAHNTYLDHGSYTKQINDFLSVFDKSRLKIVLFDDLVKKREEIFNEIIDFIGVSAFDPEYKRVNESGMPKSQLLQKMVVKFSLPKWAKKIVSADVRVKIIGFIKNLNVKKVSYPLLNPETKAELDLHYEKEIGKLERLIKKSLAHWK